MGKVVIDAAVRDVFASLYEPTEILDSAGFVLGLFTPSHPFDLDAARRAANDRSDPGISTDELIRRLEARGRGTCDTR